MFIWPTVVTFDAPENVLLSLKIGVWKVAQNLKCQTRVPQCRSYICLKVRSQPKKLHEVQQRRILKTVCIIKLSYHSCV